MPWKFHVLNIWSIACWNSSTLQQPVSDLTSTATEQIIWHLVVPVCVTEVLRWRYVKTQFQIDTSMIGCTGRHEPWEAYKWIFLWLIDHLDTSFSLHVHGLFPCLRAARAFVYFLLFVPGLPRMRLKRWWILSVFGYEHTAKSMCFKRKAIDWMIFTFGANHEFAIKRCKYSVHAKLPGLCWSICSLWRIIPKKICRHHHLASFVQEDNLASQ